MAGCDVCVYQGDYDAPETHITSHPTARKPHRCCECRELIKSGQRYERVFGKWDGRIDTYLTCELCAEIRQQFCCDGWLYTSLWEGMREQAFEHLQMAGPCWEGLSAKAKAFLLERWREWKFDN